MREIFSESSRLRSSPAIGSSEASAWTLLSPRPPAGGYNIDLGGLLQRARSELPLNSRTRRDRLDWSLRSLPRNTFEAKWQSCSHSS